MRAAAKNHARVSVLSDPRDYTEFLKAWTEGQGDVGQALRSRLALKAFEATASYDDAISGYFREQYASAELPKEKLVGPVQKQTLRYGANPHQKPAQAYVSEGELPFKGMESAAHFIYLYELIEFPSSCWLSGIHQLIGRAQLLCTCHGAPRGIKSTSSRFFQACFPCRCCCRP